MNNTNVLDFQSKREEKNLELTQNLRDNISKNIDEIILDDFFYKIKKLGKEISFKLLLSEYPNDEYFSYEDKQLIAEKILLSGNFVLLRAFSDLYGFDEYGLDIKLLIKGVKILHKNNNIDFNLNQNISITQIFELGFSIGDNKLLESLDLFRIKEYLEQDLDDNYKLKQISLVSNLDNFNIEIRKILTTLKNISHQKDFKITIQNIHAKPFFLYFKSNISNINLGGNQKIVYGDIGLFIDTFLEIVDNYSKKINNGIFFGFTLQEEIGKKDKIPPQNSFKKAA